MLLTLTNTTAPATDLGYLLHKNPARVQAFSLSFGKACVFYPEATESRCTAGLLLDIDPIAMVRGKAHAKGSGPLEQYVNDRAYVASSFLSVAIAKVFGAALNGRCHQKPELVQQPMRLSAHLAVLPVRGGAAFLERLFGPLGYGVTARRLPLDPAFPAWGHSVYYSVDLQGEQPLHSLLSHLYVLIPVLDDRKHYYVDDSEVRNLLAKGEGWLEHHPEREVIARRYLKHNLSLTRAALERLKEAPADTMPDGRTETSEAALEKHLSLNAQRIGSVLAVVKASGAVRVVDLGCGEGRLLKALLADPAFAEIVGMDVSVRALEIAAQRLKLERMPELQRSRIRLLHGSLMYRDQRLEGYDAAVVMEVIEHLDPARLAAFQRVVFACARPGMVVVTTPNREYNGVWEHLPAGQLRHSDHRFEWTRAEFSRWTHSITTCFDYQVRVLPIGPEHPDHGPPTQMAVFNRL